jgi:hypothetical protein
MFGSGYEDCPEFGVLGGVIFKLGSVLFRYLKVDRKCQK